MLVTSFFPRIGRLLCVRNHGCNTVLNRLSKTLQSREFRNENDSSTTFFLCGVGSEIPLFRFVGDVTNHARQQILRVNVWTQMQSPIVSLAHLRRLIGFLRVVY